MCHRRVLLLVLLMLACVGAVDRAAAQVPFPITAGTQILFTPNEDHALISTYEIGYFAVGAPEPTQFVSKPKTQWLAMGTEVGTSFPRLLFGVFEVRVRGCGPALPAGTLCGPWAVAVPPGATTDKTVSVSPLALTAVVVR